MQLTVAAILNAARTSPEAVTKLCAGLTDAALTAEIERLGRVGLDTIAELPSAAENDGGWHAGADNWLFVNAANVATVIMRIERDHEGIAYEVLVRDRTVDVFEGSEDQRSLWSRQVYFGQTDATVAGGAAFVRTAREQQIVADRIAAIIPRLAEVQDIRQARAALETERDRRTKAAMIATLPEDKRL